MIKKHHVTWFYSQWHFPWKHIKVEIFPLIFCVPLRLLLLFLFDAMSLSFISLISDDDKSPEIWCGFFRTVKWVSNASLSPLSSNLAGWDLLLRTSTAQDIFRLKPVVNAAGCQWASSGTHYHSQAHLQDTYQQMELWAYCWNVSFLSVFGICHTCQVWPEH